MTRFPVSWRPVLGDQLRQPYFQKLTEFLDRERRQFTVYPPEPDVFNALGRMDDGTNLHADPDNIN